MAGPYCEEFRLEGTMIDRPHLRSARRMLGAE